MKVLAGEFFADEVVAAAGFFGPVERLVGLSHELLGIRSVAGCNGNSDAHSDRNSLYHVTPFLLACRYKG